MIIAFFKAYLKGFLFCFVLFAYVSYLLLAVLLCCEAFGFIAARAFLQL